MEFLTFGPTYVLTHEGVEEVEAALAAPQQPTRHFPPIVIARNYIHVGSMVGSAIQQGSHGSTQLVEQPVDVAALRELAVDLGLALAAAGAVNGEAAGELAALEVQIAAPQPQRAAIRETLGSLRRVVEGALGSGLASAAPQLPALAERLAHLLETRHAKPRRRPRRGLNGRREPRKKRQHKPFTRLFTVVYSNKRNPRHEFGAVWRTNR